MKEEFQVSVIMPVYNAGPYVRQAVESAVRLPEVSEVILVEDKSPDNSYEECLKLQKEFSKVRLLTHEGHTNRGPGESRNLGVRNASNEYVAFLDADDYYLENRFRRDKEVLADRSIDGAYNAAAYLIDSDYAFETVSRRFKTADPKGHLFTVRETIAPKDMFFHLLNGGKGHFHTNTITVKKSCFDRVGFFSDLKLHQDTHMWLRIALNSKLVGSDTKHPTAMIRVHVNNRIKNVSRQSVTAYYDRLYADIAGSVKTRREYSTLIKKKVAARSNVYKGRYKNAPFIFLNMAIHFLRHPMDIFRVHPKHLLK